MILRFTHYQVRGLNDSARVLSLRTTVLKRRICHTNLATRQYTRAGVFITLLSLLPFMGYASCLVDCATSSANPAYFSHQDTQNTAPSVNMTNNDTRDRSHNMGDVKNSIVGDVFIRNGHDHLNISGIQSQQTMIDASITSIVNLGDTRNSQP